MKISQVTIRANREYAPFQHTRIEIVAKYDKSSESLDEILDSATAFAEQVLDKACERFSTQKTNGHDKTTSPY